MAIRVQTQDHLVFGIMAAGVTATHGRFQKAGAAPVVKQLADPVTAAAGERLRVPSGSLDIVYPAGETNNAHMRALVQPYWYGEEVQVDLMTDDSTVVDDTGYASRPTPTLLSAKKTTNPPRPIRLWLSRQSQYRLRRWIRIPDPSKGGMAFR